MQAAAIKAGAIKAALLPVSGAFHTRLMEPARAALVKARRQRSLLFFRVSCVPCSEHASTWHACIDSHFARSSLHTSGMSLLEDFMLSTDRTARLQRGTHAVALFCRP